jgi:hypothetical protein
MAGRIGQLKGHRHMRRLSPRQVAG